MQQWNTFKLRSAGRLELAAEIIERAFSVSDDRQTIDKLADALTLVRDAAMAMTQEATNGNQTGYVVRTIKAEPRTGPELITRVSRPS